MAKKVQRGLGRGLGALLGEDVVQEKAPEIVPEKKETGDEVRMLPIRLVDPNADQPRRSFDEDALKELAVLVFGCAVSSLWCAAPLAVA